MTASRCDKPQPLGSPGPGRNSRAKPRKQAGPRGLALPHAWHPLPGSSLKKSKICAPRKVRGPPLFQYTLGPKMAVPTRTIVAPWFTAMR